jgi:hypothetical protein
MSRLFQKKEERPQGKGERDGVKEQWVAAQSSPWHGVTCSPLEASRTPASHVTVKSYLTVTLNTINTKKHSPSGCLSWQVVRESRIPEQLVFRVFRKCKEVKVCKVSIENSSEESKGKRGF